MTKHYKKVGNWICLQFEREYTRKRQVFEVFLFICEKKSTSTFGHQTDVLICPRQRKSIFSLFLAKEGTKNSSLYQMSFTFWASISVSSLLFSLKPDSLRSFKTSFLSFFIFRTFSGFCSTCNSNKRLNITSNENHCAHNL